MGVGVDTATTQTRPRAGEPDGRSQTDSSRAAEVPVLLSRARVGLATAAEPDEINAHRIRQALTAAGFRISVAEADIESLIDACVGDPPEALIAAGRHDALMSASRLRELRGRLPGLPLVVVVPSTDRRSLRKAIAAGAEGCVREADVEQVLALTVATVLMGQFSVPSSMRHLVSSPAFSHREKEVLELVARGLSNGEIAQQLYLAESTVKSHLSSSFRKLGVNSRQEAAAIVLDPENGIAPHLVRTPGEVPEDTNGPAAPAA